MIFWNLNVYDIGYCGKVKLVCYIYGEMLVILFKILIYGGVGRSIF